MTNRASASTAPVAPAPLTERQRVVFAMIERYVAEYNETPPARLIARRMGVHHKTIQEHLARLNRKGWLRASRPVSVCHG